MKQHYTEMRLTPNMDAQRRLNARPFCGMKPRHYFPAMTNDWAYVDCARCLAKKPADK